MKFFENLKLFVIVSILNSKASATLTLSFAEAIVDIIEVFYVRENISFDISTFGKITSDIADDIGGIGRWQRKKLNFLLEIRHVRYIELSDLTFNQSSVLIADRYHVETVMIHARFTNRFPNDLKFVICLEKFEDFEYEMQLKMTDPKIALDDLRIY